jgi:alpha-1,3-rhamnosyltransferase
MKVDKNIEKPLVTVIVPCYNHERYIGQCINSIINQTYTNFKLIVIDDGSSDRSPELLKELQKNYGFELLLQENHGVAYALNVGIKKFSIGEYISICASDDYWALDKLEKQVNFMETNRFYPMCFGKTFYVDEDSNILLSEDVNNRRLKGGWLFDDILLFKIHPPVNYLYRTSIFSEVGYFEEKIFAEDYFMNLKISDKYEIGFIDEYLGYHRLTDIQTKTERSEIVANSHLMSIELFKENYLYKKAKTMVYLRQFWNFSGHTKYKVKAITYLVRSFSLFYHKLFILGSIQLVFKWGK